MRINHNIAALNTHRQLGNANNNQAKSMEKLSSGLRINKAGDDAAGLAISEKMRAQVRGLDQATSNSQDAISMIATAEGALTETHSILQRMRELAVQSGNGTNTDSDRKSIQDEVNQLADEINRIGNTTEFNTQKLINGSKDKTEAVGAVKNGASIAKIGAGADVFEVRSAATAGTGTGAAVTAAVTIHDGTVGKLTSGKNTALTNATTTLSTAVTATSNELTVQIGNTVRTIALATSANDGDVAADLQTKLRTAFGQSDVDAGGGPGNTGGATTGAAGISVAISGGRLVIEDGALGKGADSKISIVGGNAAGALFGGAGVDVAENGNAANNTMTVNYTKDGGLTNTAVNVTLANGTYNSPQSLAAEIESKFNAAAGAGNAGDVDFSADAALGSSIKIATGVVGGGNGVTSITGVAAGLAGLSDATFELGKSKNDTLAVNVDGNTYNVTLSAGDYADKDILASAVQTGINTQIQAWNTGNPAQPQRELVKVETQAVADTDRVRFQVTSGKEGAASQVTFGTVAGSSGAADLGFNTVSATGQNGADASVNFHIGANKDQNLKMAIGDMRSTALGITSTSNAANQTVTLQDNSVSDVNYGTNTVKNGSTTEYVIDVSTEEAANKAISVINNAIELVSAERSKLGSNQNRLEHTINNLSTSSENLTAAESRIRDVDMAKEMMNQTRESILAQASQAMLAQANQKPQAVLQLLQ